MVLEVDLDVPAKSVADLVAFAKRDGSKLSFGTWPKPASRASRPSRFLA